MLRYDTTFSCRISFLFIHSNLMVSAGGFAGGWAEGGGDAVGVQHQRQREGPLLCGGGGQVRHSGHHRGQGGHRSALELDVRSKA